MEYVYVFQDLYYMFERISIILTLLNLCNNVCSSQDSILNDIKKIFYFIHLYQEVTFYFITLPKLLQSLFSIALSVLLTSCCL